MLEQQLKSLEEFSRKTAVEMSPQKLMVKIVQDKKAALFAEERFKRIMKEKKPYTLEELERINYAMDDFVYFFTVYEIDKETLTLPSYKKKWGQSL